MADRDRRAMAWRIAAILAPIAGLIGYSAFLAWRFGNPLAWLTGQAAWGTQAGAPPASASGLDLWWLIDALPLAFVVATIIPVTRLLGAAYGLFIVLNIAPPLLRHGLMSLGRFSSVMFPAFAWLAWRVRGRARTWLIVACATLQTPSAPCSSPGTRSSERLFVNAPDPRDDLTPVVAPRHRRARATVLGRRRQQRASQRVGIRRDRFDPRHLRQRPVFAGPARPFTGQRRHAKTGGQRLEQQDRKARLPRGERIAVRRRIQVRALAARPDRERRSARRSTKAAARDLGLVVPIATVRRRRAAAAAPADRAASRAKASMIRSMPLRGSSRATLRMLVMPSANCGSGRPA